MSQPRVLEGRLALVTGASRGIGAAICNNLASKGCSLLMTYTSDSSTQNTIDHANHLAKTYSIQAHTVQADMASVQAPAYILSVARSHFAHPRTGSFRIDIIINNAGVAGIKSLADTSAVDLTEHFHAQYAVNVLGPMLLVQACAEYLPTDRSGRIVNLSSISASLGTPGQSVYGGTKAALESMTRTWSRELGDRCTVNAVNPGPVGTDMWNATTPAFKKFMSPYNALAPRAQVKEGIDPPEVVKEITENEYGGRAATPEEIAGVVGMLCTPDGSWCTGSVVCANGGMRFSY